VGEKRCACHKKILEEKTAHGQNSKLDSARKMNLKNATTIVFSVDRKIDRENESFQIALRQKMGEVSETLSIEICKLKEEATRRCLIDLGWIPPVK